MPIDLRRARPALRGPLPWTVAGAVILFALLEAAVSYSWPLVVDLDRAVADGAHDLVVGHGWLITLLDGIAFWGGPGVWRIVLAGVAIWAAVRRQWRIALWLVVLIPVQYYAVWLCKRLVARERPTFDEPITVLQSYSFPSGHATAAAMFATAATILTLVLMRRGGVRRALIVLWILIALVVGADRILLGVHFLSDVVAGYALGFVVTVVLWFLFTLQAFGTDPEPERPAVAGSGRRQVSVVLNPVKVGDVAAFRTQVRETAAAEDWAEPRFFETTVDDPGAAQAMEAIEQDADMVVVAGGDGTVREVCGELARTGISVGVVPLGTGNLLARNLGLPLHTGEAIENAFRGQDRAIDVVRMQIDDGEPSAFLVMAGLGFDAAIMGGTNDNLKKRVGWLAYVVSGIKQLFRFPRTRVEISVDGGDFVKRRALTVVVGNVGFLQGGLPLLPEAEIDDGQIDVVALSPPHKLAFLSVGLRLFARGRRTDERLDRMTGRTVTIRADRPTPMQLDGDPIGEHATLKATVEPGVLLIRTPR